MYFPAIDAKPSRTTPFVSNGGPYQELDKWNKKGKRNNEKQNVMASIPFDPLSFLRKIGVFVDVVIFVFLSTIYSRVKKSMAIISRIRATRTALFRSPFSQAVKIPVVNVLILKY